MKYLILSFIICFFVISCKKGNGNTAPEIKFLSITPAYKSALSTSGTPPPILTIEIKDAEGDIGFVDGKDTSYVYIKNITTSPFPIDSFKFPSNLANVTSKNFKAEVDIDLNRPSILINRNNRVKDTLFFEVYIKDFGKNKSNVIRTPDPLVYTL